MYLPKHASLPVTLKAREYDVFTVVPVKKLSNNIAFAPIGLTKMFNSGGAIKELNYEPENTACVHMKVRGCGPFGAYSSVKPKRIAVDNKEVDFEYEEATGFVTVALSVPEKELYLWDVIVQLCGFCNS